MLKLDPLGFLSPFVIRLKILFQVLCSEKLDWDQPLRGEMNKTWNLIFEELKPLGCVRIPRCYFVPRFSKVDVNLHGFSHPSERAYAAVVYIRVVYSDEKQIFLIETPQNEIAAQINSKYRTYFLNIHTIL